LIIIISGVGLGICQRLFRQVATQDVPVDVLPQVVQLSTTLKEKEKQGEVDGKRYGGLTLILACRSMARAEGAKRVLEEEVEATLRALCVQQQEQRRQRKGSTEAEGESSLSWRIRFCENTSVLIESLDLGSLQSVFSFASRLTRRLEAGEGLGSARSGKGKAYLTHLVLNAGINSHWKKDWVAAAKQFLTKGFVNATTAPRYMLQNVGEESGDGLGWVWQCNVFGHYVLVRLLSFSCSFTSFSDATFCYRQKHSNHSYPTPPSKSAEPSGVHPLKLSHIYTIPRRTGNFVPRHRATRARSGKLIW